MPVSLRSQIEQCNAQKAQRPNEPSKIAHFFSPSSTLSLSPFPSPSLRTNTNNASSFPAKLGRGTLHTSFQSPLSLSTHSATVSPLNPVNPPRFCVPATTTASP